MKLRAPRLLLTLLLPLGLALPLAGCKNDCRTACEKKQECVSSGLDVGQCTAQCREKADADKRFALQAELCATCLKDRACSEAVPQCLGDCVTVVGL